MKITKTQLKQIIKEELGTLNEAAEDYELMLIIQKHLEGFGDLNQLDSATIELLSEGLQKASALQDAIVKAVNELRGY